MKHQTLRIITKNVFTLFNLVNIILAVMVALVGSYKNMLFITIALANTLISIINGIRAKKIVDKLKLLSEKRPIILREGKQVAVKPEDVKKGDRLILTLGDQISFDSILEEGILEVNESFITGEQDNIEKRPGDTLVSGSFVVSGSGKAKVKNIGADNFVTKLQDEASSIKTADSKLFKLMNNIVKYISWTLIPIGALLLWSRFNTEKDTATAVTSTVAALINMLPEGLILLTSSILALATIRLGRRKVLVQDLYAIETLARVDTIALDKTGTLTTGNMTVKSYKAFEKSFETVLASILSHQMSENATTTALKKKFLKTAKFEELEGVLDVIPFSSDRKYSGIKTKDAEYLMGAIEFLTDDESIINEVKSFSGEYRAISVVKAELLPGSRSSGAWQGEEKRAVPVATGDGDAGRERVKVSLLGVVCLEDEIRPTAPKIVKYFYDNDIDIKIISGDDLGSVKTIAKKVGIKDLRGINLSELKTKDYDSLVKNHSIFTRVTPSQKKSLIKAFKKQGKTVAMTGDGVNDILAMKEADCSLAIGEGSDAARRAAKFVLLDSGFEGIPSIIDEGRQSINNLERSTTLFLTKTVYASILAVTFVFLPFSYPFSPVEMSLLNFACIGFPGLILALEKNTSRIKNLFVKNIIEYSVPVGLTVSLSMLTLSVLSHHNNFSHFELTTTSAFITFTINIILIYWISKPLNKLRATLILTIIAIMVVAFLVPFARDFFEFTFLTQNGLIIMASIIAVAIAAFLGLRIVARKLAARAGLTF